MKYERFFKFKCQECCHEFIESVEIENKEINTDRFAFCFICGEQDVYSKKYVDELLTEE
jgi:hypothetical protein